jgi:hypothetical protein
MWRLIADWNRRFNGWAREHWILFCGVVYLCGFAAIVLAELLIRGRINVSSAVIVPFGGAVGSAIGAHVRKRYDTAGRLPDGRLMRWWTKAPGPSKNPDDYR